MYFKYQNVISLKNSNLSNVLRLFFKKNICVIFMYKCHQFSETRQELIDFPVKLVINHFMKTVRYWGQAQLSS